MRGTMQNEQFTGQPREANVIYSVLTPLMIETGGSTPRTVLLPVSFSHQFQEREHPRPPAPHFTVGVAQRHIASDRRVPRKHDREAYQIRLAAE